MLGVPQPSLLWWLTYPKVPVALQVTVVPVFGTKLGLMLVSAYREQSFCHLFAADGSRPLGVRSCFSGKGSRRGRVVYALLAFGLLAGQLFARRQPPVGRTCI